VAEGTEPGSGWLPGGASSRSPRLSLGLMIAWSQGEPSRVGEITLLSSSHGTIMGRGDPTPGEEGARAFFLRARPGHTERTPPLRAAALSRQHLKIQPRGRSLEVQCVGKLPMYVNGREATQASVGAGDLVFLESQILLLCVERGNSELASHGVAPGFAFGEPDEFGIVGEGPRSWQLRDALAFFARRGGHVLIQGPSGAGKELCARALHLLSSRAEGPFLARNAATLPSGIIDAELFGNARNYPNPGMRERSGLVGEANGGTLFLDEIGELPAELQAHLLRLLDGGEYHRLGEEQPRRSDLRLLAATNRGEGSLKHDLLARLKLRLEVPGLDERREDIPLIARALLRRIAGEDEGLRRRFFEGDEARVAPELAEALLRHRYTTHVRELESLLLSAMAESPSHFLALTPSVERRLDLPEPPGASGQGTPTAEEVEAALASAEGNVSRAWKGLGLTSRDALNRLMKKYGLSPKRP
jgi:DNA-binding NtrC family response regulator